MVVLESVVILGVVGVLVEVEMGYLLLFVKDVEEFVVIFVFLVVIVKIDVFVFMCE